MEFNEIGPHFDLSFRRNKIGTPDLYKAACKQPKLMSSDTKKLKKNLYTDEFGQIRGKVFIQHQDTKTMALRKTTKRDESGKKLKRGTFRSKGSAAQ